MDRETYDKAMETLENLSLTVDKAIAKLAEIDNKIESIKSVVKTIEVCYNDIDEIKQIIPNNKTNISFMFEKYGE
jgi:prefoldin subunit 5